MSKLKIIEWETEDADGPVVYRLDDPGAGARFFRDLLANAEFDGREFFALKEITPDEWTQFEKNGEELA